MTAPAPTELLKLADEMQALQYPEFGECLSLDAYNKILFALRQAASVERAEKCEYCGGNGDVGPAKSSEGDWLDQPCPKCHGSGKVERAEVAGEAVAWGTDQSITRDAGVAQIWREAGIEVRPLVYASPPRSEGVRASEVQSEEAKLRLFLSILDAAGGETSGNDTRWNWINYFCDDAEPLDTFNQASKRKLTSVTHDSDSEDSMVYLTDAGRDFLAAPQPAPVAQASAKPAHISQGTIDNILSKLDQGAAYQGYPEGFGHSWTKLAADAATIIRRLTRSVPSAQSGGEAK